MVLVIGVLCHCEKCRRNVNVLMVLAIGSSSKFDLCWKMLRLWKLG